MIGDLPYWLAGFRKQHYNYKSILIEWQFWAAGVSLHIHTCMSQLPIVLVYEMHFIIHIYHVCMYAAYPKCIIATAVHKYYTNTHEIQRYKWYYLNAHKIYTNYLAPILIHRGHGFWKYRLQHQKCSECQYFSSWRGDTNLQEVNDELTYRKSLELYTHTLTSK